MAIFSKTQFPKYQSPIRITRPYIKPNYLADTINSAIQGYGSIQGMNMQQQLFNAKLKAAQDAKLAQQKLAIEIGTLGATTGPDTYTSPGGMGMDDVDMTRVPGVTTPNPTMAAISQLMQSGATLPQASSLAQSLYPRPDPNAQYTALRRQQIQDDRNAGIAAAETKAGQKFEALVSQVLGKGIGGYGSGDIADYMVMDPETNQLVQSKDPLANLAGSFPHGLNTRTEAYIDPATGQPGGGEGATVTTTDDNPYYKTGGQLGFQEFTQAELRPWVARMLKSGISPEDAAIQVAKAIRGGRAKQGTASGAFNYKKASAIVRMMESGNRSTDELTAIIRG